MAYKPAIVSPSSLAAVEQCPRFRPSGEDTQASLDGTMFHEYMEKIVGLPREQWDEFVEKAEISNDLKWLLRGAVETLKSLLLERLETVPDYRIKFKKGGQQFLKTKRLKPGLYTECEVELGGGRHGYIDLMIVPGDGPVYIVDWKSSRVSHDYELQLARYAMAVNTLCPQHDAFICCVVAPRLGEEDQLRLTVGPEELAKYRERVKAIEERADRSANDDSIPGCPSDACTWCHWNGCCKYQGQVMQGVVGEVAAKPTSSEDPAVAKAVDAYRALASGVFSGVRLTLTPATDAERGFRRAALKAVADIFDAVKKDDAKWVEEHPGQTEVPGFKISVARGRTSLDKSRQDEFRAAVVASYGLTDQEVLRCSAIDVGMLTDYLVDVRGAGKPTAVEKDVKRIMEPFTVSGTPTVRWTASKTAGATRAAQIGEL